MGGESFDAGYGIEGEFIEETRYIFLTRRAWWVEVTMLRDILTVATFELSSMRRSARLWIGAGIYTAAGLIAGVIYVLIVRGVETKALEVMAQSGQGMAAPFAWDAAKDEAYRKLVETFAGGDTAMINALIDVPPILLFFFWGSLAFMPYLIVLLSFDQMAAELQHRSAFFALLRVRREALYWGKYGANMVLYVGLSVLLSLIMLGLGAAVLSKFNVMPALIFQLKAYLLLIPFGACYLGITSLWSSAVRSPFLALIGSLATMFGLWVVSLLHYAENASAPWKFLAYLAYLTPAHWEDMLWSPHPQDLALVCAVYVAFAALFAGGGMWHFSRRDLH